MIKIRNGEIEDKIKIIVYVYPNKTVSGIWKMICVFSFTYLKIENQS